MRLRNSLRNSFYSVLSYTLFFIFGYITRKLFLHYFSLEYLGYEGLFSNVFSVLSLSEMGVAGIVLYGLYSSVAKGDRAETQKLMSLYKQIYRAIGAAVFVLGVVLSFFLSSIVSGATYDMDFIRQIYFLQLASTLCTYFLGYRRALFLANQQAHVCIKVDMIVGLTSKAVRILVIILLHNYILFLMIDLFSNILSNLWLAVRCKKDYPDIAPVRVTLADFKERSFFKNVGNMMMTKVSATIQGATDGIFISAILGITTVGQVANYTFIVGNIKDIIYKIYNPLEASVANYVHSTPEEEGRKVYRMIEYISFLIASSLSIGFLFLLQPVVSVIFGTQYLLPDAYVIALAVYAYVEWYANVLTIYRNAFGRFELDRNFAVLGSVGNVAIKVVLGPIFGIAGIVAGTILSQVCFWCGRLRVVYTEYIREGYWAYWRRFALKTLLFLGEVGLIFLLLRLSSHILYTLLVPLSIPILVNLLIFRHTEEHAMFISYAKKALRLRKTDTAEPLPEEERT